MHFYIGVTDEQWFDFHKLRNPDEVNFWRPMSRLDFKALKFGEPFLFKLHYPNNYIVGGGFFANYSRLPLTVAWDVFEEKNGASDLILLRDAITHYREKRKLLFEPNPNIGCITLTSPVFFDEDLWFPAPEDWSSNIVQGKTYDAGNEIGMYIWKEFEERLQFANIRPARNFPGPKLIAETRARYGEGYITKPRLGQSAFRVLVIDAYKRRCSITGERTLPVLQASHIKPYAQQGPHSVDNGILLRADLHLLFDAGYITITEDRHVVVSERIKAEFENGKEYYVLHGKPLMILPDHQAQHPGKEFLLWHNEQIFKV
jgi:putative restriction endonuclease